MAEDQRTAQVTLTADTSNYQQAMIQADQVTAKATNSVIKLLDSVNKLTSSAGRKMIGVGAIEVAGLVAATTAAARLESQMSQLSASSVITGRDFGVMSATVTGLRTSLGLTTTEAVSLVKQLNTLGQGQQNIASLADTFVRLGAVTGESVSGLTDGLVSLQRAMGTEGATAAQHFASSLAALSQQAGVSATGVLQFANSIAPIAKMAGMTQTQVMGISTAFSKAGQDGYAAANTFNKMLTDITRAVQYGSPDLASYANLVGKTVDQFKGMNSADQINEIFSAINKQGPAAIKTLERFGLDGIKSTKAIQGLVQSGGLQSPLAIAEAAQKDTTKFIDASNEALKGLDNTTSKLGQTLQQIGESFGKGLIGPANAAVSAINALLSPLNSMLQAFGSIPGIAAAGAAGMLLLGGALLKGFGAMSALGTLQTVRKNWGGAGFRTAMDNQKGTDEQFTRRMAAGEGTWAQRSLYATGENIGKGIRRVGAVTGATDLGAMWRESGVGDKSLGTRLNNVGAGAIRGVGSFMRAGLEPLYPAQVMDPSSRTPMFGQAQTARGPIAIAGEKLAAGADKLRLPAVVGEKLAASFLSLNNAMNPNIPIAKSTGSAFKELILESGRLGAALAKAGIGTIGLAGGAAARGIGKLGSSAMGLVGGPMGVAAIAGTIGYEKWQDRNKTLDAIATNTEDKSALSAYRIALSEASTGVTDFATAAKKAAADIKSSTGTDMTKKQAIDLSKEDLGAIRKGNYTDARVGNMNEAQAKQFAGVALATASPADARLLALDMAKRFGTGAQGILDSAYNSKPDVGGLFEQITANTSANPFGSQDSMQASADLASSTAKQWMTNAPTKDLNKIGLATTQGALSAYLNDSRTPGRDFGTGMTSRAAIGDALTNALGMGTNDEGSRKAIRASMDAVANTALNAKPAAGDPLGRKHVTATNDQLTAMLTQLAGSGDSAAAIQAKDLLAAQKAGGNTSNAWALPLNSAAPQTMFGGMDPATLDAYRQTAIGKQALNAYNPYGAAVNSALNETGNVGKQQIGANAINQVGQDLSPATANLTATQLNMTYKDQINNLALFKRSINDATDATSQLADAAQTFVRGQQSRQEQFQTTDVTAAARVGNFNSDVSRIKAGDISPDAFKSLNQDATSVRESIQSAGDYFKGIVTANRNYQVQTQRTEIAYALQKKRSETAFALQQGYQLTDFNRQRTISDNAFNLSRARAQRDLGIQQKESLYSYNLSRKRGEADFNHQVVVMAKQSAKSVYDVYSRVKVEQTWSAQSLLANMADQQRRLDEQQANLAKVRSMGLSGNVIDQLGLNDPSKAQQLARMVDELVNNPQMVATFNKGMTDRVNSATKVVTDKDNAAWQEMLRSYNQNLTRGAEDFQHGLAVQNAAFAQSMTDQRTDYDLSISLSIESFNLNRKRQTVGFQLGMSEMAHDHKVMMDNAATDFSFAYQQITASFNTMGVEAVKSLTGTAKAQAQALLDVLGPMAAEIDNTLTGLGIVKSAAAVAATQNKQVAGHPNTPGLAGMAEGGRVEGFSPHSKADNIVIKATAGEYVQPVDVVQHYGVKFMDKVREKRLPMDGGGYAAGGLVTATGSNTRVPIDGQVVDPKTFAIIKAAETLIGTHLTVAQGSWSTRVAASGGTHAGAGASDTVPSNANWDASVAALRSKGGIAWHRLPSQGPWMPHIHMITPGISGLSPAAASQVQQYLRGGDGLGGRDPGPAVNMAGLPAGYIAMMVANAGGSGTMGSGITRDQLKNIIGGLGTVRRFDEALKGTPGFSKRIPDGWLEGLVADQYAPAISAGQQVNISGSASAQVNEKIAAGMLTKYGWGQDQLGPLIQLWNGESGWNQFAKNPSSGAYGIPQSLPANKMSSAGPDWLNNPATQIQWGLQYIKDRYASPAGAFSQWGARSPHWYSEGGMFNAKKIIGVGEGGPEAVLPLNRKGASFLADVMTQMTTAESKKAMVHAGSTTTTAKTATYYQRVDHSTNFTGAISVTSNDPNEFIRKLEDQKRLKALTGR